VSSHALREKMPTSWARLLDLGVKVVFIDRTIPALATDARVVTGVAGESDR